MHGLEHQAPVVAPDVQDALGAQDVGALPRQQVVEPRRHLLRIDRPIGAERDALDVIVVLMVVVIVIPGMVVIAVVVVHMASLAVGRVQELRLQLEDAVEVEAAAPEDRLQRHVRALRAVDRRQRIQPPQPRLDRLQVVNARRGRSC